MCPQGFSKRAAERTWRIVLAYRPILRAVPRKFTATNTGDAEPNKSKNNQKQHDNFAKLLYIRNHKLMYAC